jgi:hypothetical protein
MSKNKSSCFPFSCTSSNCVCTANIANLSNDELLRLIGEKSTEKVSAIMKSNQRKINELNQNISFLESIQQNRLKKTENKLKKQTNELNKISNLLSTPLNRSIPKSVTGNKTTKEMIKEKKINLEANEMITQFELNNIEEKFKNGKINELTYQKDKKTLKNKLNKLKRELNSI